ncbi:MAG: PRC-barrel domain-containing protein [Candidatus Sumerlaeia bacterium]
MKRSLKELRNYIIKGTDDDLGSVHDFYFDDASWKIRYLVVDTGNWLPGRKVLIPVSALEKADWETRLFHVNLTARQIEESPEIASDKPVSKQNEIDLHAYFGWTPYWGTGQALAGPGGMAAPPVTALKEDAEAKVNPEAERGDPHLRSCDEVEGYHISAEDDKIGHVEDFLADDEDWSILYLHVDTKNWWPGKHVLIAPSWITGINWAEALVHVRMTKKEIEESPEYKPGMDIDHRYEEELYAHYGFPGYWI